MKRIIDIPDNEYRHIKEYYEKNDIVEATYSYIYHGTPLDDVFDKIRAEIEQTVSRYSISRECGCMGQIEWSDRLIKESEVLQIIDKYKAESEDKDADKKCTYKETGCGSCKRQLDCPIEADTTESEDKA